MKKAYRVSADESRLYPMGLTEIPGGIHAAFASPASSCALLLYRKGRKALKERILFPEAGRIGDVWSMTVQGDFTDLEYTFEADGKEVPDPYGKSFGERARWAHAEHRERVPRALCRGQEPFDWGKDRNPEIPLEDTVIYHMHVRGFTKHPSSGVSQEDRGTFRGILDKIPYMKELGVTAVEIMPPAEFEELIPEKLLDGPLLSAESVSSPEKKINYWGYIPALGFAPKAAYAGEGRTPEQEFKNLAKCLHEAGMELIIELYFDGTQPQAYGLDMVRWWVREYHVDGVHLVGYAPLDLLAADPFLSRTKLFANGWGERKKEGARHLAEYGPEFMLEMRSFLKGDEGQLDNLAKNIRKNPEAVGAVNYMANTDGFTMMDMVSYDRKHNEANGEDGRDGTDYNQSWNCGAEGPTRKKKILALRKKQLKNAMLLLFLSQGTPLLMAGDEFGRTKKGNNNSYCQDNEISWVNWGLLKTNRDLYEFTKYVIAFRKAHPVFHMEKEPALMDYRSVGIPDVSYHGVKAWRPEFESFRRQLGIFYCGKYGIKPDGGEDDYFYVACNMHWEPHAFALPHLPKGMSWHIAFDTDDKEGSGFFEPGQEPVLENPREVMVMARTIMVFIGKKDSAHNETTPLID